MMLLLLYFSLFLFFFFFKQKTAYEMRISDWSSDVCSSDLAHVNALYDELRIALHAVWQRRWTALAAAWAICLLGWLAVAQIPKIGRASCRERVCQYV